MNRLLGTIAITLVLLSSGALGCGAPVRGGQAVQTVTLSADSNEEYPPQKPSRYLGKFVYQHNCAECHGQVGPAPDDPQFKLRVPGYIRTAEEAKADDANFKTWFDAQPKPESPFYPPAQGAYTDLYTYSWFKNGSQYSYTDPNQAPLADMQLKELYAMLSTEHGDPGKEVNFSKSLSDRERWAAAFYTMNISLDNGQPDWKQTWDQQIALRKTLYGTHCSICHGGVGRGDGPEGKHLEPPPMNYNNIDWATGARPGYPVTNAYLFDIIANGKIKPGSQTVWTGMPWWKDQLRETDMWALVDYVRSLSYDSD